MVARARGRLSERETAAAGQTKEMLAEATAASEAREAERQAERADYESLRNKHEALQEEHRALGLAVAQAEARDAVSSEVRYELR